MSAERTKKRTETLLRTAVKISVAAAAFWALFTFVLGVQIYHGQRMYPAVRDGDLVVISRICELRSGDIAAYTGSGGKTDLSRVVGTPGYEIDITDIGELKTNGYVPLENIYYRTERIEESCLPYPVNLKKGEYFLLDDYRTIGEDSRIFGAVSEKDIKGKVIYLIRRRGF